MGILRGRDHQVPSHRSIITLPHSVHIMDIVTDHKKYKHTALNDYRRNSEFVWWSMLILNGTDSRITLELHLVMAVGDHLDYVNWDRKLYTLWVYYSLARVLAHVHVGKELIGNTYFLVSAFWLQVWCDQPSQAPGALTSLLLWTVLLNCEP